MGKDYTSRKTSYSKKLSPSFEEGFDGIASGRLRFEAELALKRFHLLPYFNSVVTLDECMEEEKRIFRSTGKICPRSKPHPYSILMAVREIKIPNPRCGYVGDVVDDILAARAAKKEWR